MIDINYFVLLLFSIYILGKKINLRYFSYIEGKVWLKGW